MLASTSRGLRIGTSTITSTGIVSVQRVLPPYAGRTSQVHATHRASPVTPPTGSATPRSGASRDTPKSAKAVGPWNLRGSCLETTPSLRVARHPDTPDEGDIPEFGRPGTLDGPDSDHGTRVTGNATPRSGASRTKANISTWNFFFSAQPWPSCVFRAEIPQN